MRKTNNTKDFDREGVNSFWVVYDAGTDETLTFYIEDEPDRSEWKSVIIEEDVGAPTLHEVEYSARFSSVADALAAGRAMAQYIVGMHPEDTIDLEVRHVVSEMTEVVTDVRTIVTVTETRTMPDRVASEGAERTMDLDSDDDDYEEEEDPYSVEEDEEDEEEEEEEEFPPSQLYRKAQPEAAFYTPLEVKAPKAKKKKSTKR